MCEIDDRAVEQDCQEMRQIVQSGPYGKGPYVVGVDVATGLDYSSLVIYDKDRDEFFDEDTFRAYLAGLLELPSETEKVLREMEREKRGER